MNSVGEAKNYCYIPRLNSRDKPLKQNTMEIRVKLNGERRTIKVVFAKPADFKFVAEWQNALGDDQSRKRKDAVEFARLAVKKFEANRESGIYANSLSDISDHVLNNPKEEVGAFVILKCDWYHGTEVVGFCHFRRSWANKIILDYLGAHPHIAKEADDETHKVRGVGKAICYYIAQVLKQENCPAVWGETTPLSAIFYAGAFELENVDDLLNIPKEKVSAFAEKVEKKWADEDANGIQSDDEIDKLEIENPPFVGSKLAVFNPQKRLAFRFLNLGYHKQMEIAQTLHLIRAGGAALTRDQLASQVFTSAKDKGKLAELWDLVKKEYGDAIQEENPFETKPITKK